MTAPAALVCDFVNSYDVESDTDALSSPAALAAWLGRRGLVEPGTTAGDEDLAVAVDLREALRAALRHHHGRGPAGDGQDEDGQDRASAPHAFDRLPVTVVLTAGGPVLEPAVTGTLGGLARIAVAVMEVRAEGSWPRLKVCTESTCQWAFVDSSKNRSRSWCSMKVCGNRTKTRAYRARRQTGTGSRHL
ncbi:CGNR zinc finger domain-containing protein [Planomonospora sp. ID67723]|uniref:CGNR zinc finger domain-containing protein n=1 Tax=Planomonospora sp. ID67723 TaxID=2738134 RepID=UPI0018C41148|nr:CGNR zinc finger domain-containing protein [Planomonospora sp. ID67723]MBG0828805.1 CGNR zinc finger domain-containing protein [Planomonospora sp. ID67723]